SGVQGDQLVGQLRQSLAGLKRRTGPLASQNYRLALTLTSAFCQQLAEVGSRVEVSASPCWCVMGRVSGVLEQRWGGDHDDAGVVGGGGRRDEVGGVGDAF